MYRDQRVSQREAIRTIHSRKYNEIDSGRFICPPIETQPGKRLPGRVMMGGQVRIFCIFN